MIPEAAVEAEMKHTPVGVAIMDGTNDAVICGTCGVVRGGYVRAGEWPCEMAAQS